MKIKMALLFLFAICLMGSVYGQVRNGGTFNNDVPDPNNGRTISDINWRPKLSLGVGIGIANIWGNLPTSNTMPAARIGIGCRLTDKLIVGIEGYAGQLSSQQNRNDWTVTGFKETSTFESINISGKVTVGDYLKHKESKLLQILSGVYVGGGYGTIYSSISSNYGRFAPAYVADNKILSSGKMFHKSVISPFVPLIVGLRVPLPNFLGTENSQFMLNYQINYTFTDNLSGYNFSDLIVKNKSNNAYTVITAGFSFFITK